ncbi:MAG: DUF3298 and DUF4163 domain-containing protein [Firmicutes bacterium]|nr:DUF3298 domain-containing protein [Bacillota bacterium]NLL88423.1 DUF3298 and DUF4163 domain-containing protein [Bacillota bacterium]HKM17053.1 DUF3298 domain-containing protein [Limnochordia bacterium]
MYLAARKGTEAFVMLIIMAVSLSLAAYPILAESEYQANPYWYRIIGGRPNTDVVILSRVYEKDSPAYASVLSIPVIHGMRDAELYEQLNRMFYDGIIHFDHEVEASIQRFLQDSSLSGQQWPKSITEVDFKVNYNSGGILSLTVRFSHDFGFDQRAQFMETVNVDLTTGRVIKFEDLFASEQERNILLRTINDQIKKSPNVYFREIRPADLVELQSFYIRENKIIIYFDAEAIAPSTFGIPEFEFEVGSALNELIRNP